MGTYKIEGRLEIDEERGVIYFHKSNGLTVFRLQGLPTPIKFINTTMLDVKVQPGVHCSWDGE